MPSPYTLHPVTLADTDAMMATGVAAFQHDPLFAATFPPELVDPANPTEQDDWRRRRLHKRLATPGVVMHKILAEDGASVAGFSGWVAPQKEEGEGDGGAAMEEKEEEEVEGGIKKKTVANAANPLGELPSCARRELFEEQLRLMDETKKRVLGETKDFWYLSSLATHPDHQGKGVGAALVRWGIEQGEKDGVPVYLEATPHGFFLYKKLGFEPVYEIDMSKWIPNGGSYRVQVMLKKPSSKTQ